MAKSDPTYAGRVDDRGHPFTHFGKNRVLAGVKKQWLIVINEKVIELKIKFRHIDRNSIEFRTNFSDFSHVFLPYCMDISMYSRLQVHPPPQVVEAP